MKKALILNGNIVDVAAAEFPVSPEMSWVDCPDDCEAHQWTFDGVACNPPPKPSLDEVKESKRKAINAARDAEEAAGFDYLGKRFDSDAQAIKRLYGAAMAAQAAIAGGMPSDSVMVTWTCADGTTIDLTYAQAAAVPVTMAQVSAVLHIKARQLKAQALAATSIEQLETINW